MTVAQEYTAVRKRLARHFGAGEARAMTLLVFHSMYGWNTADIFMRDDMEMAPEAVERIGQILSRVEGGEPIQYVLGEAYFYGMWLKVAPGVLIPRPETAELVDWIVADSNGRKDLRVLDVCAGSGCVAIALYRNLMFPQVSGLDISREALDVARENAARLHASVRWLEADIFSYVPEPRSLDIMVSNPPYIAESEKKNMDINVLHHEPSQALFVPDDDPLRFYLRIADVAREALAPGGSLYFEINPLYAGSLTDALALLGFVGVEVRNDSFGRKRMLRCSLPIRQ